MASPLDLWMKEFEDASKLADDISTMISEKNSLPSSGRETQRHMSAIRRKITILGTKVDTLDSLLAKLPSKQPVKEKELHKRQEMLHNLRSRVKQMGSSMSMSSFANREELLGPNKKGDDMSRVQGLDNWGIVSVQRQIMKEQDEGLEKLEDTVLSTKHIALAVNEELDLHTRLIGDLDEHVDQTDSRLRRVQKRLVAMNARARGGCSCFALLLGVVAIVILAFIIYALIKYL